VHQDNVFGDRYVGCLALCLNTLAGPFQFLSKPMVLPKEENLKWGVGLGVRNSTFMDNNVPGRCKKRCYIGLDLQSRLTCFCENVID